VEDFEPPRPLQRPVYLCDRRFYVDPLFDLLDSPERFGFVVIGGKECVFGLVAGRTKSVLHRFRVDLPKKHSKGGQSSVRFDRQRTEARQNYVRIVAETANHIFLSGSEANVTGLIVAGQAEGLKGQFASSEVLDHRLRKLILVKVRVAYGGDQGFNEAIERGMSVMGDQPIQREQALLKAALEELLKQDPRVTFGASETLRAWEAGAVEKLIVFENLDQWRCILRDDSGAEVVGFFTGKQLEAGTQFKGDAAELVEAVLLTEWLAEHHALQGSQLEFVGDASEEAARFLRLGGIGGMLRWRMEPEAGVAAVDDDFDSDFETPL
jgi:peptide chain release factor subunit 1